MDETMRDEFKEFHAKEIFDLRQDIGRWQEQRANLERSSITAILAIWTFAAGYSHPESTEIIGVFVWWVPVIACFFTIKRIESYENTITQVTEYLKHVYGKVADPGLKGWMVWRDSEENNSREKAGQTRATKTMWWCMFALSTLVAFVATFSFFWHR